ncbi:sigma-70 family RNA polymerase sigma factor [Kribbella sp. NPDC051770]|uniref:sigma-70 family RNA polymerase sigma factor n=1 Tax=Kribbella sp. NPDC051770 TaxID=3155413 RepID=UPI00343339FC
MDDATPVSWDEIVRVHSVRVYHFAYRLTGNRHDAEDLTHDVFVRVFRYLHTYRPNTFEGWLYRITTNLFFDQLRHRNRLHFDGLAPGTVSDQDLDPAHLYEFRTLDDDIRIALNELTPQMRAVVVLRDIESLSYRQIATTLGVEVGTVGSRLHRARSNLRASLAHRAFNGSGGAEPLPSATAAGR